MNRPGSIPRHSMDELGVPMFVKTLCHDSRHPARHYPHRDDYWLFACVTGGSASVAVDFTEMTLSAGDAVIISPMQVHSPAPYSKDVKGWLLAVASEFLSADNAALADKYSLNPSPIHLDSSTADDLDKLAAMLERHLNAGKGDITPAAVAIASAMINLISACAVTGIARSADRYMNIALRLKKLLSEHLHKEKSPSYYAGELHISEVYLNEAVKAVTGMNVSRFIRNQIIIGAKRQLSYSSEQAQEIALRLGYDDYAYFSKIFKKETGLTPSEYRKNLR